MDSIIGYVVLFIVGLTVLYAYQWRKIKKRDLSLSRQAYADAILELFIQKQHGKTQKIILQIIAKTDLQLQDIAVELIGKKREFQTVKFSTDDSDKLIFISKNNRHHFLIDPDFFKKFISEQGAEFRTFRLIVTNDKGKKFKTHELAFNSKWTLFKPDSGKYN